MFGDYRTGRLVLLKGLLTVHSFTVAHRRHAARPHAANLFWSFVVASVAELLLKLSLSCFSIELLLN